MFARVENRNEVIRETAPKQQQSLIINLLLHRQINRFRNLLNVLLEISVRVG